MTRKIRNRQTYEDWLQGDGAELATYKESNSASNETPAALQAATPSTSEDEESEDDGTEPDPRQSNAMDLTGCEDDESFDNMNEDDDDDVEDDGFSFLDEEDDHDTADLSDDENDEDDENGSHDGDGRQQSHVSARFP